MKMPTRTADDLSVPCDAMGLSKDAGWHGDLALNGLTMNCPGLRVFTNFLISNSLASPL